MCPQSLRMHKVISTATSRFLTPRHGAKKKEEERLVGLQHRGVPTPQTERGGNDEPERGGNGAGPEPRWRAERRGAPGAPTAPGWVLEAAPRVSA